MGRAPTPPYLGGPPPAPASKRKNNVVGARGAVHQYIIARVCGGASSLHIARKLLAHDPR